MDFNGQKSPPKLEHNTAPSGDIVPRKELIDSYTFAYFASPYRLLSVIASFNAYADDGFGDEQQSELAWSIDEEGKRGVWVVARNLKSKNTNDGDYFLLIINQQGRAYSK